MPRVFAIDGVPCSGMIYADRWLRGVEEIPIQQGAKISFELSNNFACEWVGPLGWYWNVPRAVRNTVWVVVANTGNRVAGVADESPEGPVVRHGHSAVVAPDGQIVARANETETIVIAEIDPSRATREEAVARATNSVLREFWETGLKLQQGQKLPAPELAPLASPETELTLAVSQLTGDVSKMVHAIREACARKADLIVFPARAVPGMALETLRAAARENAMLVVFGAEHAGGSDTGPRRGADAMAPTNSAFVIGPDGAVLTRYDQTTVSNGKRRLGDEVSRQRRPGLRDHRA